MKTILFDFDGTLADTSKGIVISYQKAFSELNMTIPDESFIRCTIGPPLKDMLRIMSPNSDEDIIDELAVAYRNYYSEQGLFQLDFYDGIIPLLKKYVNDAVLGIVSSKPESFIIKILEKYSLSNYFTLISGVSLGFDNKSKKERLKDMIALNHLNNKDCVMIGDRSEDLHSATYAKVHFIGVRYGFGSDNEFPSDTHVATDVTELSRLLDEFLKE